MSNWYSTRERKYPCTECGRKPGDSHLYLCSRSKLSTRKPGKAGKRWVWVSSILVDKGPRGEDPIEYGMRPKKLDDFRTQRMQGTYVNKNKLPSRRDLHRRKACTTSA